MKILTALWKASLIVLLTAQLAHAEAVRIGVLAYEPKEVAQKKWAPLVAYLHARLPAYEISIEICKLDELNDGVKTGAFEFVLTNPGHYVILRDADAVGQAVASLRNDAGGRASAEFGGVVFTLANRKDIGTLKNLPGKRIASVSEESLGGYQMQAYEATKSDVDFRDFKMKWTGMPQDKVVQAVLKGEADAGFVRTGVLERMMSGGALTREQIKIIHPREYDRFPQLISTDLYPEWAFVPAISTDRDIVRKITAELLNISPGDEISVKMGIKGFDAPYNYDKVRDVLLALGMPPYDTVKSVIFRTTWRENKLFVYFGAGILSVFTLLFALLVISYRKLKSLSSQLESLSFTDGLTRVFNRRYFDEQLSRQLEICLRNKTALSLVLLDIDHFKNVNDQYGHQVGDEILIEVSRRLSRATRKSDIVARYGGEEFAIICVGSDAPEAAMTAERVRSAIASDPVEFRNVLHQIRISAGVATLTENANSNAEKLIAAADEALYRAKASGRDRVVAAD